MGWRRSGERPRQACPALRFPPPEAPQGAANGLRPGAVAESAPFTAALAQRFDNLPANVVTRAGPDNRRQKAADGQPGDRAWRAGGSESATRKEESEPWHPGTSKPIAPVTRPSTTRTSRP